MKTKINARLLSCVLFVIILTAVFSNVKAGICLGGAAASIYTIAASKTMKKLQ